MSTQRPHIVLIITGGTIGSKVDPATGAAAAVDSAEELVGMVRGIDEIAHIELAPFAIVNSWNMTPDAMFALAADIRRHLDRPEVTGVVVTHGTDTVEESALMAELLTQSPKPVVFTAAMRNLSETGSDGPRNLFDAIRVAAHPPMNGYGVTLVANEVVHAARYVTKTNTVNPATFQSPEYGPIGQVTSNAIRVLRAAPPRRTLETESIAAKVPVVSAVAGTDPDVLEWYLRRRVDGIVVEGSGAGNVPSIFAQGIARVIDAGIPVVLTTRVQNGFLSPTYGSGAASGGGFDLNRIGVIPSVYWRAPKARIALMVGIGGGFDAHRLREIFANP